MLWWCARARVDQHRCCGLILQTRLLGFHVVLLSIWHGMRQTRLCNYTLYCRSLVLRINVPSGKHFSNAQTTALHIKNSLTIDKGCDGGGNAQTLKFKMNWKRKRKARGTTIGAKRREKKHTHRGETSKRPILNRLLFYQFQGKRSAATGRFCSHCRRHKHGWHWLWLFSIEVFSSRKMIVTKLCKCKAVAEWIDWSIERTAFDAVECWLFTYKWCVAIAIAIVANL